MTCIVRFFLLLLCLTLAHTASAAAARAMDCHDTAAHPQIQTRITPVLATMPAHDAHAVHASAHSQQQLSAEHTHADCDCAAKCGCPQHCASSGLTTQALWSVLTPALPAFVAVAVSTDVPSTRISSLFRPPIAALG